MRQVMRAVLASLLLCAPLSGQGVLAQETAPDPALLVADAVTVEGGNRLVATGNVEALYDGAVLTAGGVVYDQTTDSLVLTGPIRITYPDGTILLSDAAELDAGFRNGLLQGARMVLDQQLQLAAVAARRVDGRYTELSKVAVTSCQVCAGKTPLWQIRASRVVHDQAARQLYFDEAQLRFLDVPVFYLPRLRLPDPTLKRARGFLIPEIKSSTLLGFGIRAPYFIPLGDHADITLSPYLSPVTRTLEARYRQAFRTGTITANGALSSDTLLTGQTRGYLFAEGAFDLGHEFKLTFDIEAVNDASYLSDYDFADKDRLDSNLTISRVRRDEYAAVSLTHFESLLASESNATLPTIVGDLTYERRFHPRLGEELRFGAEAHSHYRYSDLDIAGRDMSRMNAEVAWLNRWTLPGGIRAGVEAQLFADRFEVRQDSSAASSTSQLTPAAKVELRWPWVKTTTGGARILVEPVAQIAWTGGDRPLTPNDESTRVEFDEGNLLALSRFPSPDRRERGQVSAAGLRWLREDDAGWSGGLTFGRIWRETADADFTASSGLDGTASDWLIAGHVATAQGLSLTARGLWDGEFRFSKAEARAAWRHGRADIAATYVLLGADTAENRATTLSEWNFDGAYDLSEFWTVSANGRYDLAADNIAKAGLGLTYANECIEVGLRVSRRFTSSTNVEPSTNFGLTVALKGFSTGGNATNYRRSCGS